MPHCKIALKLFEHFVSQKVLGVIPVKMRQSTIVGTVQDDPFDSWVGEVLVQALPSCNVFHSGKLTTPDIIIRDRDTNALLGLEVKKLIQKENGADPRGLTMDFNSCIPCGKALIRVGNDLAQIPCFYLFALLNPSSSGIVTLAIMDGDFLNYDFNLHKEAKVANTSEYNHGPYGEGSVRRRAMYTYPNVLNAKLETFHLKTQLILKKLDSDNLKLNQFCSSIIERNDIYDNTFRYSVISESKVSMQGTPKIITGIFDACKKRVSKKRVASTPKINLL